MLPDFARLSKLLPDFSSFIKQLQGYKEEVQELYGNSWFVIEQQKALGAYLRLPDISPNIENLREIFRPPDLQTLRRSLSLPSTLGKSVQDIGNKITSISNFNNLLPSAKLPDNLSSEIISLQSGFKYLQERIENILPSKDVFNGMLSPSERVVNAIGGLLISCKGHNPAFPLALQLLSAYQDFVSQQINEGEEDQPEIRERRLMVMDLTGDVMERSQISNEIAMTFSSKRTINPIPKHVKINLFSMINQCLADLFDKKRKDNIYLAFQNSYPVQLNSLGSATVELTYRINQYSRRMTGESVFLPTNNSMYACMLIPSVIADSEDEFGKIVDYLYFLLYEGSGDGKRLTNMMKAEELDPLWKLKHLRLGFRHDVEHGDQRAIKKKEMKIGGAYKDLIKKPTPVTAADWRNAQLMIYQQLAEMLKLVRERQETMVE